MKVNVKNFEQFLKSGEYGEEDGMGYDDLELEQTTRVKPMRTAATKNKKEDASVYKNHDSKRYHKKY